MSEWTQVIAKRAAYHPVLDSYEYEERTFTDSYMTNCKKANMKPLEALTLFFGGGNRNV